MVELTKIRKNPYDYIRNHYESIYPFIGSKLFSILALLPVSLIMPKIPRDGKMIKNKLNLCILSPSGSGKSSIAEEFEKITFNPLSTEKITPARLYFEINKKIGENTNPKISLIVSDVATLFSDEIMLKILEGILGEEGCISRSTMRNKEDETKKKIDAIAYLSGTPENISNHRIRTGLLFRTMTLIVFHTHEEHEKILEFISKNMGKEGHIKSSEYIKQFYEELWSIQRGENSGIHPVESYEISDEINEEVSKFIKPLARGIFQRYGITSARSVEEFYRIMCAHAMLNIYNRTILDGRIIIEKEDVELAKKLIKRDIATKSIILQCIESIDYYNIKTRNQLREWEERRRKSQKPIPKEAKFLLGGMMKDK